MIKVKVSTNLDVFDAAIGEIMDAVSQNLEEVAETVYQSAKTTVAFRDKSGRLRRSIALKKSKYEDGYIVQARGTNKEGGGYHAHLIEYGHGLIAWGHPSKKTKFVAARPFMRPAKEEGIKKALQLFRQK
jgi:hypothetical protein